MSILDFFTTLFTGAGLAMDAFAVSVANGISLKKTRISSAVETGLFFGFFQFLMPLVAYFVSGIFSEEIRSYDHIVALIILSFLGIKMIFESSKSSAIQTKSPIYISAKILIPQAVATSIDALAVGVTYSVLGLSISAAITNCIIIGFVTFFICTLGVLLGRKLGAKLNKKAGILGGIILILIGLKIFITDII